MDAGIIAVGSELLTPFRVDTNSLVITERLNAIGIDLRFKAVVGDDRRQVARVVREALDHVQLIVCTGGLGPTEDDVTREAVAQALDMPLDLDAGIADRIRQRFARRGLVMSEINLRQAMVPRGATVLENPNGTAPGLLIERGGVTIVLLPGPPREMTPMLDALVGERLAHWTGGIPLLRRVLRIAGRTESDVDAHTQPIYAPWRHQAVPIETTILAVMGQIELHLTAAASSRAEADAALDSAVRALETELGSSVFSVDGRPLEAVVGDLLRARQWRVSVAESCSGGLLASRLTDVPGSSDYVERGVVCYSDRSKIDLLGVPEGLIAEHGAVSEPVARAMAEGIRGRSGTNVGIGITGIAGPGGGSPEKPVGTVVIAVVTDRGDELRTFQFIGGREQVKYQSTQAALNMLRLMLLRQSAA
jgi:nicotinamide-nucleotide amidase